MLENETNGSSKSNQSGHTARCPYSNGYPLWFRGSWRCTGRQRIDVLILLDGDHRDLKHEDELAGELYDIELATGVLVSPTIMLRKQWENRPFKTPFYINVMNEGIRI